MSSPVIAQRLPLLKQAPLSAQVYLRKALYALATVIFKHVRPFYPAHQPDLLKTYPGDPSGIPCRIFLPRDDHSEPAAGTGNTGNEKKKKQIPLYIDIHGGGFVFGSAELDDRDNWLLARKHGIRVVAINYRKAPRHPWPTPVHDAEATVAAVLDDDDGTLAGLGVDTTDPRRVALGGYSAGAMLALTSGMAPALRARVGGVVAVYPPADETRSRERRLAASKRAPGRRRDALDGVLDAFRWAYIAPGTDAREPRLSPFFAERAALPEKVFVLGVEYDMLCAEAREMAEKWAAEEGEQRLREPVSEQARAMSEAEMEEDVKAQKAPNPVDDRWTKGTISWELIKDVEHGFNQTPASGEKKVLVRKRKEEMIASIGDWLFREVYC